LQRARQAPKSIFALSERSGRRRHRQNRRCLARKDTALAAPSQFRFEQRAEPPELKALRGEVRTFLADEERNGSWRPGPEGWAGFDRDFSRRLARKGWIGMTWPRQYGGGERSAIERHVVTEELLSAGAPVRAHWVADRQSGPVLLRFGTEAQCERYLPRIALGECTFCIGMSEADSGSDLASVRTRAVKVDGGWRVNGAKLWTSNAQRAHIMILFARTAPAEEDRRGGVSQFLVDLSWPGITVRGIENLAGEADFNEVVFEDVFVPEDMLIGTEGNGWNQVSSELTYERSGPDRWLSTYFLLRQMAAWSAVNAPERGCAATGRLVAHLWTLQRMSRSIAGMLQQGVTPATEAALVKDLGTTFEREIPEVARMVVPESVRLQDPQAATLHEALVRATMHAPSFSIRGGTREILRGIVAKSLGMR
jgi:acyl-CoA dehydrogenase